MNHTDVQNLANRMLDQLEQVIVGKRDVLALILTSVFANGHVLLQDVPGVAKTAIARSVAQVAGLQFSRVQFTPDLIPADISGASVLTPTGDIEFQPGPVFANLVLGDEINRAPPKTQSALLEAMEERQVTADGVSRPLPSPFIVIGTQNPIEQEGTYPLPEAQLDRFLIRTGIGYPGTANEVNMVLRRSQRKTDQTQLAPVISAQDLLTIQRSVEDVYVSEPVATYVVNLVEATRTSTMTEIGASPRGSLALVKAGRAVAAMSGRSHLLPDDVKQIARAALAHRIILQPDQWVRGVKSDQVVDQILAGVPAPSATEPHDAQPATNYQPTQAMTAPIPAAQTSRNQPGGAWGPPPSSPAGSQPNPTNYYPR